MNWVKTIDQLPPQWAGELDFELLFVFKNDLGVYPGHRDENGIWIGDITQSMEDLEYWMPLPERPKE